MYNTICVCLYIFDIHSAVCNHLGICSLPYRFKANTTLKMFSMFCFFGFEECLAAWHMIAQVPFGKGQLVKPLPCGQPLLSRRWCHLQHQTFCQGRQVLKKKHGHHPRSLALLLMASSLVKCWFSSCLLMIPMTSLYFGLCFLVT